MRGTWSGVSSAGCIESLAYDFVAWIGTRCVQVAQAHYRTGQPEAYRASDVFARKCAITAVLIYFLLGLVGLSLLILRIAVALALAVTPVFYILRVRTRRLRKFEESLPDAIDLFNRSMKAGHNIHAGLETIAQENV